MSFPENSGIEYDPGIIAPGERVKTVFVSLGGYAMREPVPLHPDKAEEVVTEESEVNNG